MREPRFRCGERPERSDSLPTATSAKAPWGKAAAWDATRADPVRRRVSRTGRAGWSPRARRRRGHPLQERSRSRPNLSPCPYGRGTLPHSRSPWHFASLRVVDDARLKQSGDLAQLDVARGRTWDPFRVTLPRGSPATGLLLWHLQAGPRHGPRDLSCPTTGTVQTSGTAEVATLSCARRSNAGRSRVTEARGVRWRRAPACALRSLSGRLDVALVRDRRLGGVRRRESPARRIDA